MFTMPEIMCDVFSFLDKDQIERIQLVNQFWNNVIIRHKNIWPLRQFLELQFHRNRFHHYATVEVRCLHLISYSINFDGINFYKNFEEDVSSQHSQLTVDEVLTNLNNVFFDLIQIYGYNSEDRPDLLNMMKLVTTKSGGRFRGKFGNWYVGRFGWSQLAEIFANYIIVDELSFINYHDDSFIREVCANPEIVQLPSAPKEIWLRYLDFKENDEVLNFTCNGKLNGANRLAIDFKTSDTNFGSFLRQWFELYRTHENPISLVGKFELRVQYSLNIREAVKTFLNNTQLLVKYSLERFHISSHRVIYQCVKRSCVLHETDSYALVIEMEYGGIFRYDMSGINASDLDQPSHYKMNRISLCVKLL